MRKIHDDERKSSVINSLTYDLAYPANPLSLRCDFIFHERSSPAIAGLRAEHKLPAWTRLFVLLKGRVEIRMGKRLYVLSAPGIHLIPTSQPFSACYPDLTEMYAFHLDFTANSAISVTSEIREVLSLKDERSAYTVAGLHKSGNRPALQSFVFHTVLRMVSPFLDAVADRANIFGEFSSLADFIEKGQAGSLSITALARKMGVLPDTLSRRFKRKTGVPLHSFIMRNRLKAAKRMVLSDGTSTENIVQNLGFADRFHFYRFFKQHTGLSPSEYRNQRQTLSIG